MEMLETRENRRPNPLDVLMTKAQIVRKEFKAALPRRIRNILLSKMEAMARTMELIDRFRSGMKHASLDPDDVMVALVFHQPETPGLENIAKYIWLPVPDKIGEFVSKVMSLDRPVFLGLLFCQTDHEAKPEKRYTAFVWQFMGGPEAEKYLVAAKRHFVKGGHNALDN